MVNKLGLTMNNKFAILLIVHGIAVFFYSNIAVSKVEFPKPLFCEQPESGFFIGDIMRLCECGCGQPTKVITLTDKRQGRIKGEYSRFLIGHQFKNKNKGKNHPLYGKHHAKTTKDKMSKARLGKSPWNKDKTDVYSNETLKKMSGENGSNYKDGKSLQKVYCRDCGNQIHYSAIYCRNCFSRGERNGRWRDGISFEPYPITFNQQLKDRIRVRDNFVCQLCGVPELEYNKRLSVHHIDYDKKNCREDNLITLCNKCNLKANSNRKYWTNYFMEKLNNVK